MRRGVRIPSWYLLLVAVLGILSGCQSLRDLEHLAIRRNSVLSGALGIELRRPPSDSAFRYVHPGEAVSDRETQRRMPKLDPSAMIA
jgi:hypothetical protein